MSDRFVALFVYVPEAARCVGDGQKFPVLVFVDPPTASLDAWVHIHPSTRLSCIVSDTKIVPFNKIIWIENLPANADHTFHIQATAAGHNPAWHRGKIRRDLSVNVPAPPTIVYPTNGCQFSAAFTAYGYVTPATDPVSAWVVDSNNNIYPGTPVTPPQGYDWAASFSGLPAGSYTLHAEDTSTDRTASPVSITET